MCTSAGWGDMRCRRRWQLLWSVKRSKHLVVKLTLLLHTFTMFSNIHRCLLWCWTQEMALMLTGPLLKMMFKNSKRWAALFLFLIGVSGSENHCMFESKFCSVTKLGGRRGLPMMHCISSPFSEVMGERPRIRSFHLTGGNFKQGVAAALSSSESWFFFFRSCFFVAISFTSVVSVLFPCLWFLFMTIIVWQ